VNRPIACLALLTDAYGGRGGIAQYNRDLARALASSPEIRAVEILPRIAPDPPGDAPDKVRQHDPRPGRLGYCLEALRLAAQIKPELILCGHLYMAPLAALLAWRTKARLVVQTHGVEAWPRASLAQRLAVARADVVLAVSRDTRARVLDWADLPADRVRVAPNTVAEDFSPGDGAAMRARLGLTDQFVILSVGRLDARDGYKGQDRVIPLLPGLVIPGREVVYLVAGEGDDQPRLEALAWEHGAQRQVRFLGHVPRADLPDLYRAAQLFALPSGGEGFGIVFLEAMACGVPAIGLAVGGAVDALCDGELGIAASEADFAPALRRACRDVASGALIAGEPLAQRVTRRFGRMAFARRIHEAIGPLERAAA
jgi:phosphatidylinositol alpha-1,6-mannosyltransferase